MPNINPVDLQTLGARVTDPAQLTEGRWYAVRVNCSGTHNPLVHAQYIGNFGRTDEFLVAADDYKALGRTMNLARHIYRDNDSIRTGRIHGGGVCEVFKFKQVKDEPAIPSVPKPASVKEVSPYEDSDYATCARYGIKVWDKFKVINADKYSKLSVGDVVTLTYDDDSSVPYFVNDSTGETIVIRLYRLVPLVANQSNTSAPTATLSPIDQIKSEIDALNAQKQIKQEEIDKLTKDVATIGGEVDKLKQKVADSLKEYLPEPKKPIW